MAAFVVALWLADVAYGLLAREEIDEKNLHAKYHQYFRGPDREVTDFNKALAAGQVVPVDYRELIEARELVTGASARITADGWIRLSGAEFAIDPWIGKGGRERIAVHGTRHNDGIYWVLELAGHDAVKVERPLRDEVVTLQLDIRGLRERHMWAPGLVWYICYGGLEGTERAAYFDELGCVENRMNSVGIRDREEVAQPKPPGQRRILCLGDSFTFGWGVKFEDAWTQRVERELRKTDDAIRTVNCGASGCMFADEYAVALENRFYKLEPDAVVMTLCLNDLLPTAHALAHQEPLPWLLRQSRVLRDLLQGYALEGTLRIDPGRDLVRELFDLDERLYSTFCRPEPPISVGRASLWPGGAPQRAILKARDFCRAHDLPFGVVIWPYFQGLGEHDHYPFEPMHQLVGDFCGENEIPFLDLLSTFRGKVSNTAELWVCLADYHGNERAQAMATPPLTDFLDLVLNER